MEFENKPLSEIISEIIDYRGKTPKKLGGDWSNDGIRALSAKNIKTGKIVQEETIRYVDEDLYKKWMKQEIERGTILITSEAPFGEVYYWDSDEKIVLSQRLFALKIKKDFNPKYIYYYMCSSKFQSELRGRSTGSTVSGLRQPELLRCNVEIPSRKYQDKIADILSVIENKMEINNNLSNELIRLQKMLFNKMMNADNVLNNSESNLTDIVDVMNGYSYTGSELTDESNTALITIKNFSRNGGFKSDGFKPLVPKKAKTSNYCNLYDVFVSCTDLTQAADIIGNAILLLDKERYDNIIASSDIVKIVPKNSILNSSNFKKHALGYKTGTTVLHLNKKCFDDYKIKLPDEKEIVEYSKKAESIFKRISNTIVENSKLEILKSELLSKLLNNCLDLEDINI